MAGSSEAIRSPGNQHYKRHKDDRVRNDSAGAVVSRRPLGIERLLQAVAARAIRSERSDASSSEALSQQSPIVVEIRYTSMDVGRPGAAIAAPPTRIPQWTWTAPQPSLRKRSKCEQI